MLINSKNKIILIKNGKVIKGNYEGKIDLAVTFKKHNTAYLLRIQYEGDNKTLSSLQKEFKINEAILRTMNSSLENVFTEKRIEELVREMKSIEI